MFDLSEFMINVLRKPTRNLLSSRGTVTCPALSHEDLCYLWYLRILYLRKDKRRCEGLSKISNSCSWVASVLLIVIFKFRLVRHERPQLPSHGCYEQWCWRGVVFNQYWSGCQLPYSRWLASYPSSSRHTWGQRSRCPAPRKICITCCCCCCHLMSPDSEWAVFLPELPSTQVFYLTSFDMATV